jgi:hypothetical protein
VVPQTPSSPLWWSRTRLVRGVFTLLIIGAALAFLVARSAPDLLTIPLVHATPTAASKVVVEGTYSSSIDIFTVPPLHLPTLASGSPCPTVPGRTVNPNLGPAIGDGPVYLVGAGVLDVAPAKNFGSLEWGGQKTLYAIGPQYQGYVLLRGHQLDGPDEVRFDIGDVPPDQQLWQAAPSRLINDGWSDLITYTRVRASGCYGVQADGSNFSEVIIFQAVLH